MSELSAFRGAAGEVVRGFVHPATLGTCFPVMVCTIVLSALVGPIVAAMGLPNWLVLSIASIATAPILGLFAMSARTGSLSCGFFEALTQHGGRVPGFVLRYAALALPFAAIAGLSIEQIGASIGSMAMSGASGLTGSLVWVGLFLIAAVLGPTIGLLIAVRTDTVAEALSPGAWGWVLGERRGDLPAYFASAIVGLLLFWMLAFPGIALVGAMAVAASPEAGLVVASLAWMAPFAASPILLGRLAGAFACGDSLERKTPQVLALKAVERRAESDLGGALRDAQQLAEAWPRSALALVLHARLAKRAGLDEEARAAAGHAVPVCFETGAAPLAIDLFLEFSAEANPLGLDGPTWLSLGKALAARSRGAAAHWCLRAAAALHADAAVVDKARIHLAEASLAVERADEALTIYETLLAERPDSTFAEFARQGAALARKKLPTSA